MKRFAIAIMILSGALLGGGALANAQEYPPEPTTTTVAATTTTLVGGGVPTTTQVPTGVIPATGSSGNGLTLTIAGVFLAAGIGLYLVSMARRQAAPA
jgi:LPXTG-motif cell wall-anchored protein